jgi:hypothetical protein
MLNEKHKNIVRLVIPPKRLNLKAIFKAFSVANSEVV